MLNRVVLQGRTTHHPELTHTKKGTAILRFSIAVNGINSTSFFDCFMKGKDAESHELMGKGTEVFIVGQLMQRRYKRKNGGNSFKTEVFAEECNYITFSDYDGTGQNEARNEVIHSG